jgi:alpha-galactosidase
MIARRERFGKIRGRIRQSAEKDADVHWRAEEAKMRETRICYIGGGSAEWAVKLMRDLALQQHLTGELRLYDIDSAAAETNRHLGTMLFAHPDATAKFRVWCPGEMEAALDGADVVIVSIEPGPTEMRYCDLEIPARYGIMQPVGDTTGPGGILRAWRAVPIIVDLSEKIRAYAPEAWVVNYTNPMTLCTAALFEGYPRIRAVGCCHEVPTIRRHLEEFFGVRAARVSDESNAIHMEVAGVNHFVFASAIQMQGEDLLSQLKVHAERPETRTDMRHIAAERKAREAWFEHDHRIALEFLRRFGVYGCAGDRHLAEFVPWFLSSEAELERYGVVATPYWWRKRRADDRTARRPEEEARVLKPSGEEGVALIDALLGGVETRTNVNLPNRGQIPWLPRGHIVETYATVQRDAISPETPPRLGTAPEELVRRVAAVQTLALQAAIERDQRTLLEAVLTDPLVHLPVSDAERMVAEMIECMARQDSRP